MVEALLVRERGFIVRITVFGSGDQISTGMEGRKLGADFAQSNFAGLFGNQCRFIAPGLQNSIHEFDTIKVLLNFVQRYIPGVRIQ